MRFQIVSEYGDGLGIATHLSSEGHAVDLVCSIPIGSGIVNVHTEEPPTNAADLYYFDFDLMGQLADRYRSSGYKVIGPSHWSEMISKDEEYADKVIDLVGWDRNSVTEGTHLHITTLFNGQSFTMTFSSLVYNRFMNGGKGIDIGLSGAVANFFQPTERVYNEFLKPLMPILRKINHRGAFHIHALIKDDKYSVKSINASLSSPLMCMMYDNINIPTSDILLRLLNESSKPIQPIEQWGALVTLSVPPFPYDIPNYPQTPVNNLQLPALRHIWFTDAVKQGDGWYTGNAHGKLGYVAARGASVREATKRMYRTVGNLKVNDLQYRTDIGAPNIEPYLTNLKDFKWMK